MKARIKSNGKIVEVVSRFMPKKRNAPSRDWMCNLSDGTCIDEKELEYAPDISDTDTSATISSILNEFGRKVAGKCYGMSPVSDSCGIVVNKVNTEEYINRIVDAVRERMMKDAGRAWQKCLDERQRLADLHSELEAREDALDEAYANFLKENEEREDEIERLILDTLSEEPDKDLKEAADEYSKRVSDGHNYRDLTCGFIAGAEWQKEQDQPITGNSLEQEWLRYVDRKKKECGGELPSLGEYGWLQIARHFAKWQKEQMLKESVEGKVRNIIIHENGDEVHYSINYPKGESRHSINDNVKIIIL